MNKEGIEVKAKLHKNLPMFIAILFIVMNFSCTGTPRSKFSYNENYNINFPVIDEECKDAAVLLGIDISQARDIAEKAIHSLNAKIQKKTDTYIIAQRGRHIGVFSGRGGEILTVRLKKVSPQSTFVTAVTSTGTFFISGSAPWSCQLIDKIVLLLSK